MRLPTRTITAAAALATGLFTGLTSAHAQSFDGADIEGFIAVMKGAEAIGERYEGQYDEEATAFSQQAGLDFTDFGSLLDEDGDFRIFRLSAEAMGRAGDIPPVRDYRQLVTSSGFDGLSDYGETADAIMMAWMAIQMDAEDMAGMGDMADMPPEMMAMMPAGVREQMAGVMKLATAVRNVPAEDLDAIRPYQARLDAAFD